MYRISIKNFLTPTIKDQRFGPVTGVIGLAVTLVSLFLLECVVNEKLGVYVDGFAVEGGVGLEVEGGRAVGGGRLLQQLQALVQIVLQITVYVNMKNTL